MTELDFVMLSFCADNIKELTIGPLSPSLETLLLPSSTVYLNMATCHNLTANIILPCLTELSNLRELNISNTFIYETIAIEDSITFPHLRSLNVSNTPVTNTLLLSFLGAAPGLKALIMSNCSATTDQLFTNTKQMAIDFLAAEGTTPITPIQVANIVGRCPKLESLKLGGNATIQSSSFKYLPRLLNLKHLEIDYINSNTSMEDLTHLTYINKLQTISINGSNISDAVFLKLLDIATLRRVSIYQCKNISARAAFLSLAKRPDITFIS